MGAWRSNGEGEGEGNHSDDILRDRQHLYGCKFADNRTKGGRRRRTHTQRSIFLPHSPPPSKVGSAKALVVIYGDRCFYVGLIFGRPDQCLELF